ncbi:cell division protein FtsQ/DivIB [Protaetiibacter larvae]|uniref:FtsQ-type POTRA domain-containing protein n=1 Tax=Protaetiibacter larvae TaxID=2592654 RepID=A0A5C1Y9K9_9MICO|nr:cell division protein FtsQ/DivIB [Protaetiibacter larvae]QEO09975.1 FtsQ-type POTRA domain-containing protein [Protaetiibacter larvae]
MKRPAGFDAPAEAPAERAPRGKTPAPERPTPVREKPARETPARATSVREKPVREKRPPRSSAARLATAELRAAERARRRQERLELRRFTRRTRRRRIAWLIGVGLVVTLVGISLGAVYSPLLALREIRVDGTVRLDPAQIVDAIDGQEGVPLALLDESRLREELGGFRLIRSYTTEILPPGTLIVHVSERTPIGSILRGGSFELVDAAGVMIDSTPERTPGVPLIQVADDDVESAAYRSVAEVLLALPPELLAQVDTVVASTRDDVTLGMVGSSQRVEWGGAENSAHKARVLAALLAIHAGSGPGSYDVSAPGSAVFRKG